MNRSFRAFFWGIMLLAYLPAAQGKEFLVVNYSAVQELGGMIEFCNAQLPFSLAYRELDPFDSQTVEEALQTVAQQRNERNLAVIGIMAASDIGCHFALNRDQMIAVINVTPLKTDDSERTLRRVQRLILRGVAFLFGLPPAPDYFCVTHPYESTGDLDVMGRNFTPPYMEIIRRMAEERGLPIRPPEVDSLD